MLQTQYDVRLSGNHYYSQGGGGCTVDKPILIVWLSLYSLY